MMAFIEQEANEKAEEIDAKVWHSWSVIYTHARGFCFLHEHFF